MGARGTGSGRWRLPRALRKVTGWGICSQSRDPQTRRQPISDMPPQPFRFHRPRPPATPVSRYDAVRAGATCGPCGLADHDGRDLGMAVDCLQHAMPPFQALR
jgi:hypothetical protein